LGVSGRLAAAFQANALTPLLAVPQLTHYLLDGWIWKMPPGSPLRRWLELPC
jgi:hypothetical protein